MILIVSIFRKKIQKPDYYQYHPNPSLYVHISYNVIFTHLYLFVICKPKPKNLR